MVVSVAENDPSFRTTSEVIASSNAITASNSISTSMVRGDSAGSRREARASVIVASPSLLIPKVNNWTAASLQQSLTSAEASRLSSPVHIIPNHWHIRITMYIVFVGIYVFMSWAVSQYWTELQVPVRLPWHNKISSMMATNLALYPLVVYFNYQQVNAYCQLPSISCLQMLQLLKTVFVELISGEISFECHNHSL
jgi:hypothetical protein